MSNTIGDNIAFFRRKNGLTQKELANKVGLSVSFISHLENGISNPSNESLYKISNVLGVSPNELTDNGKTYSKNEDNELVELLIKITEDEKIYWEKIDEPQDINTCVYEVIIKGTEYILSYNYKISNNEQYINYVKLDIKINSSEYLDPIVSESQDDSLLINLIKTIENLERDKSPKFRLINELEEIEKDDNVDPNTIFAPF